MLFKGLPCFGTVVLVLLTFDHADAQNQRINYTEQLTKGIEEFAFSLIFRLPLQQRQKSIVVSPFSVWAMMSVLSEGAGGDTALQLKLGLRHPMGSPQANQALRDNFSRFAAAFNVKTSTVELETTNSIFADSSYNIYQDFQNLIKSKYLTNIYPIDFYNVQQTAAVINKSVKDSTRGRIPQVVSEGDLTDVKLLLINAIFFHGQWTLPFNSSLTTEEKFYDDSMAEIGKVKMMYQRAPYPYVNSNIFKAQIVEIPYGKENRLSMILMIPKFGVKLEEVCRKFETVTVSELFRSLQRAADEFPDDEIDLYLPRFKISTSLNLNKILSEMGMDTAFHPQYADFSNISPRNDLFLSRVIHKAQIEVTEEGTVATAVTVGELSNRNIPPKVVANKPFAYLIVEKTTNVVVFGGMYVAPKLF